MTLYRRSFAGIALAAFAAVSAAPLMAQESYTLKFGHTGAPDPPGEHDPGRGPEGRRVLLAGSGRLGRAVTTRGSMWRSISRLPELMMSSLTS